MIALSSHKENIHAGVALRELPQGHVPTNLCFNRNNLNK